MEFAAALITLSGPRAMLTATRPESHRRRKSDPLLAQNLASRFTGPQSENHFRIARQERQFELKRE